MSIYVYVYILYVLCLCVYICYILYTSICVYMSTYMYYIYICVSILYVCMCLHISVIYIIHLYVCLYMYVCHYTYICRYIRNSDIMYLLWRFCSKYWTNDLYVCVEKQARRFLKSVISFRARVTIWNDNDGGLPSSRSRVVINVSQTSVSPSKDFSYLPPHVN
jgi:hypothetical protein